MEELEALGILDALSKFNSDKLDLESALNNCALLSSTIYALPDCPVRRRLFSAVESVLIGLWQESYFGRKRLGKRADRFIVSVLSILNDVATGICFSPVTVWFGGEQAGLETDLLNNAISFLSSCWHAAALAVSICGACEIEDLLKLSAHLIPPTSCLASALLLQDERCLSATVALLHLETAKINVPSQLRSLLLFQHIFFSISYDHKVVLDWLCSEVAAVPFVLRLLKMLNEKHDVMETQQCGSGFSCHRCCEKNKKDRLVRSKATLSGDHLILHIRQLHGDLPVVTAHIFSACEGEVRSVTSKYSDEETGSDQQIVECFRSLCNSCILLQHSDDVPFNVTPIIAAFEQLKTIMVQKRA